MREEQRRGQRERERERERKRERERERKKWGQRGVIPARKAYEFLKELVHRQPCCKSKDVKGFLQLSNCHLFHLHALYNELNITFIMP